MPAQISYCLRTLHLSHGLKMIFCVPITGLTQGFLENPSILLYFFSTLAQSAAAFIAVIAVFSVFRLQANATSIDDIWRDAYVWLQQVDAHQARLAFSKKKIMELLDKTPENDADEWKRKITKSKEFPKKLASKMSVCMKNWSIIFLFSLAFLLWPKWDFLFKGIGLISIICMIISTACVLRQTKKFIQYCLDPKHDNDPVRDEG